MKSRTIAAGIVAAVMVTALSGCATVFEGKYKFSDGWRTATVVRAATGDSIKNPRFWECTRRLTEAELVSRDFVLLRYRGVNRAENRMVPAVPGLELQPGEKVYLNLSTCEQAIVKRATPGPRVGPA